MKNKLISEKYTKNMDVIICDHIRYYYKSEVHNSLGVEYNVGISMFDLVFLFTL